MIIMRVVIVHYHLRSGGVKRVVRHAVDALRRQKISVAVLTGEDPADESLRDIPLAVMPELAYGADMHSISAEQLLEKVKQCACELLGDSPDIWHIHNHSLGKNSTLPLLVHQLANDGQHLYLQIHDFAEDARPANYACLHNALKSCASGGLDDLLYPLGTHVHYAALNSRDATFLAAAGCPTGGLHLLPNAACLDGQEESCPGAERQNEYLWLYPTRGIRRKNLGEFLLWSALGDPGDTFGVTMAPENPEQRAFYDPWVQFANENSLPVQFEMGADSASFTELLQQANAVVTTSIAEGFGLAFLEPWLMDRPLAGRNLKEITSDFTRHGLCLDDLYEEVWVPLEWVGASRFLNTLSEGLQSFYQSYWHSCSGEIIQRAYDASVRDGNVAFGKLDEQMQMDVIERLLKHPEFRSEICPNALPKQIDAERIRSNCEVVKRLYNLEQYGKRLIEQYRVLLNQTPSIVTSLSARRLLECFMDPRRFSLLRT